MSYKFKDNETLVFDKTMHLTNNYDGKKYYLQNMTYKQ